MRRPDIFTTRPIKVTDRIVANSASTAREKDDLREYFISISASLNRTGNRRTKLPRMRTTGKHTPNEALRSTREQAGMEWEAVYLHRLHWVVQKQAGQDMGPALICASH